MRDTSPLITLSLLQASSSCPPQRGVKQSRDILLFRELLLESGVHAGPLLGVLLTPSASVVLQGRRADDCEGEAVERGEGFGVLPLCHSPETSSPPHHHTQGTRRAHSRESTTLCGTHKEATRGNTTTPFIQHTVRTHAYISHSTRAQRTAPLHT